MLVVSKAEADVIREKCKDVCITKTMKGRSKAKRGKRYAPAYDCVLKLLAAMRGCKVVDI